MRIGTSGGRKAESGRRFFFHPLSALRFPLFIIAFRFPLSEQHRANRQLAIKPAASLVESFGDEVRRELLMELFARRWRTIFSPIAPLSERHRAAVVPAVDDFGHTAHLCAGGEGGVVGDRVDVRLMDF